MNLIKTLNRMNIKNRKGILTVLFVVLVFGGMAFAEEGKLPDPKLSEMTQQLLNFLVGALSWIWVILSIWAGKFMTNTFIYGGFINLDTYLRQWRNIMKNFANFALGFLFLFYIFKGLFSKEGVLSGIKDKITKILIAVVAIQASWFAMGAIIDISTVLTVSISSFPSQIIANSDTAKQEFLNSMNNITNMKYKVEYRPNQNQNPWITTKGVDLTSEEKENLLDYILPNHNNLSGPLLYMGLSVFEFQEFTNIRKNDEDVSWDDILTDVSLNFILVFFYTVLLAFLLLFNFFRMLILWIIIPFLPIIILIWAFEFDSLTEKLGGIASMKNILTLIFKPVFYVLYLSVAMIFLMLTHKMLDSRPDAEHSVNSLQTAIISQQGGDSIMEVENLFKFTLTSARHGLGSLFLFAIAIGVTYMLVKLSVTQGTGIKALDDGVNKARDVANKGVGNIPIIPVSGGRVGIKAVANVAEKDPRNYQTFIDKNSKNADALRKTFNLDSAEDTLMELAEAGSSSFKSHFSDYLKTKGGKGKIMDYKQFIIPYLQNNTEGKRWTTEYGSLSDTTLVANKSARESLQDILGFNISDTGSVAKFNVNKPLEGSGTTGSTPPVKKPAAGGQTPAQ